MARCNKLTQLSDAEAFEEVGAQHDIVPRPNDEDDEDSVANPTSKKKRSAPKKRTMPEEREGRKGDEIVVPLTKKLKNFKTHISKRWKNVMRFFKLFKDDTIIPTLDGRFEYKPSKGSASYVRDLPDQHHGFLLVKDKVVP